MDRQKVKVAIIGLGENGRGHAECHVRSARSELVALCDRNRTRLEEAGKTLGVAKLYTGEEVFADPEVEAISIHTGDADHAEPFIRALEAGKHVLVEKPVANCEADLVRMAEAARKASASLRIQVGYILRFNPVFERIQQLARQGELGEIYYVEADYIHNLLYQKHQIDPVTGGNWYLDHELPMAGGGSHCLDLLRWITGREVTHVSSYSNHVAFPEMVHDDCMVSLFRLEGGAIAKVAALYGPRCAMAPYYNLRVYGTRGTVERDEVALSRSDEDVHPAFEPVRAERCAGHPYDLEVEDWLEAILEDRPTRTGFRDGAASTMGTLCAVRAAREGREVEVPSL